MSKDLLAKYYQNKKKRRQKKARKRYQSLCKEGKEKTPHYGRERSKNLPEDEKLELVE